MLFTHRLQGRLYTEVYNLIPVHIKNLFPTDQADVSLQNSVNLDQYEISQGKTQA